VPDHHRQEPDLNSRSAQFKRLAEYLDHCRQQRKTVTYLQVADAIDILAPHRIRRLAELLEALMEYDHKHNHPLRAALVVSRNRAGLPAEGFFLKAQALSLMPVVNAEEFHQLCLNHLFDEPASTTIDVK
jgi:hypothetical protein